MIRTLVSQQLKAQRVYVAWTTALLAAAAALATYAWSAAATDGAMTSSHSAGEVHSREYHAPAMLVPPGFDEPAMEDWGTPLTVAELADVVQTANAQGAEAVARVRLNGVLVPPPGYLLDEQTWIADGLALEGPDLWESLLAAGKAPETGEVVLTASLASDLGLDLGDTVEVGGLEYNGSAVSPTPDGEDESPNRQWSAGERVLVGLAYDEALWRAGTWFLPTVYFSVNDPYVIRDASAAVQWPLGLANPVTATVAWETSTPATLSTFPEAQHSNGVGARGTTPLLPVWLAVILAGGVLVTATATGRAQAQQRAKWTATARALGATRGTVAAATVVEGIVMGLVGAALGLACGVAAAQWQLSTIYATLTAPPPISLQVTLAQVISITLGCLVLGLTVTGLPAVLSSRIPPAAALQATKAVDEVEFSRRVTIWPVVAGWLVAGGVVVWILADYSPGSLTPFWIAASIFAILTFTLMVEGSRRLAVWLGGWLLRRRSPAAIRAGLDMHGHPRQAAALMVVQMVTMTGIAGVGAASTVTAAYWYGATPAYLTFSHGTESFTFLWRGGEVIVTVLIIASALCAAVFAGTQRMSNADSTTASALGLSPRDTRAATVLRLALPQGIGTLVGAACGFACGSAVFLVADSWLSIWTQPSQIGVFLLIGGVIVAAMAVANLTLIALASLPWLLRKRSATRRHDHEDVTASPLESSTR